MADPRSSDLLRQAAAVGGAPACALPVAVALASNTGGGSAADTGSVLSNCGPDWVGEALL
jgi:hypothetical protein